MAAPEATCHSVAATQPAARQPPSQLTAHVDEDGFTTVSGKKRLNNRRKYEVTGVSQSTLLRGVAAPPRYMDLFVGRLDPSTTAEAVTSHVDWLLGETGKVTTVEIPHCFRLSPSKKLFTSTLVRVALCMRIFWTQARPSIVSAIRNSLKFSL